MSMRTIARSSSKRKSASALASSVLPTPVGPRNRNEPVGRSGSVIPARARRTASETARDRALLADQPARRASSSIRSSFSVSPSQQPPGGDAGPGAIDVGDVVRADLLLDHRRLAAGRRQRRRLGRAAASRAPAPARGSRRRAAGRRRPRSPSRCSRSAWPRRSSSCCLEVADPVQAGLLLLPAGVQRGQLLVAVGQVRAQAARAAPGRPGRSRARRASSSIFSRSTGRRSSSISTGEESISIRSREAASSIRSIALSGSWRPVM